MTDQHQPPKIEHAHPGVRVMVVLTPLLFSILTWTLVGSLFVVEHEAGNRTDLFALLALTVLAFVFWLATYAVAVLVDTHPHDHMFLMLAMTATVVFSGFALLTLPVMALVLGALLWYRRGIFHALHEHVRFTPHKTVSAALSFTLTLLLLGVSIQSLYASTPLQGPRALLDGLLNGMVTVADRVAPRVIPGYERNKPLDTYYSERLNESLPENVAPIAETQVRTTREKLAEYLQIPLTGRETMSEVFRLAMEHRVRPTVLGSISLFLPILVLTLFLLLKLFSPLLWVAIVGVGSGLFHLYHRFRIVRVVTESQPVERLRVT